MSEQQSPITCLADIEIGQKLRVKLKTATATEPAEVDIAGTELGIGTAEALTKAGDPIAVNLYNNSKTLEMVALNAIDVGEEVEAVAGGKVGVFSAGTKVGLALQASTADGDIIEILPYGVLA
jgi:hypothetical protein